LRAVSWAWPWIARTLRCWAEFWSRVLGRPLADGATIDTTVVLADDDPAHGPRLGFHRVPEPNPAKTAFTSTCLPAISTPSRRDCSRWAR
jgi:hypothetical protein